MSEDELDRELVRAAQERKEHAPAFSVSRYGQRLLGYCQDIAPDLGDADREHIVADAIEKAVAKIDKFDPERAKFGTWVRGFVLNRVRDWRRDNERLLSIADEERSITEPATDAIGTLLTHNRTTTETRPVPTATSHCSTPCWKHCPSCDPTTRSSSPCETSKAEVSNPSPHP